MADDAMKAAADRKKQAEEARKASFEQMKKDRQEQAKANDEKMARDAKLRPTPTPEEMQKAAAGLDVENEPDGSPEQDIYRHIVTPANQIEKTSEAKPASSTYTTRAAEPHKKV